MKELSKTVHIKLIEIFVHAINSIVAGQSNKLILLLSQGAFIGHQ